MKAPSAGRFVVEISLLFVAVTAQAAGGWSPTAFVTPPDEVLEAADVVDVDTEGESLLLLRHEIRYSYDDDGRETAVQTLVYRYLTAAGVDGWDVVSATWEPWHEQRPQLRARVITPDGTAVPLDPETISEAPADPSGSDLFDDRVVVQAPLPVAKAGAIVEEEVTTIETEPRFPGGALHRFYPTWSIPTVESRLVVELPAGRELRWKALLLDDVEPMIETVDGRRRWTFEFAPPPIEEDPEPNLPFDVPRYPNVSFSTGDSWADIASAYAEVIDRRIADDGIDDIGLDVDSLSTPDRVAAALSWVRDRLRYTGLEFGESSIVPYPPGQIVTRGFGDCKDQATVLVAILRSWGIDADVALLNAGYHRDIDPDLPGLGGFNHVIVHVAGDAPMWVDPVARYMQPGSLPPSDAGRLALIADPASRAPVTIPDAGPADHGETEQRLFELADTGASRVVSTTEPWGSYEQRYRRNYASNNKDDTHDLLDDWVQEAFLADELTGFEHTDPENMDEPFRLTITVDKARRGLTGYDEAQVAVRFDDLVSEFPSALVDESDEPRQHDFLYPRPFTIEWRYRAVPPFGFEAADLPESRTTELGTATLVEQYSVADDGAIEAVFSLDSGPRRITAEQFEATHAALLELDERAWESLYFVHTGVQLLESGETAAGLVELARLADEHPEGALHQVRLARGLLQVGLGEEARTAADRAVELDRESVAALTSKAWILQHDLIGRRFGPGFDLSGAISAYRDAKELDDFDLESWLNLAILLEYSDEGRRYGDGADLDGAIAEYIAAKEAHDEFTFDHNLMVAMLWAGRWAEILERYPELGDATNENIIILTAVAATDGVDEAIRRARATREDADSIRAMLIEVGRLLAQQRLYQRSAEMFRTAAHGAPNAAELLSYALTMNLARRAEELEIDRSTPEGTVHAYYASLADRDADDVAMSDFVSTRLTSRLDREQLTDLGLLSGGFIDSISRQAAVSPAVLVDLAIAAMEILVDGDASDVRRVHLRSSFGPGAHDETIFMIREGDEYRLAGGGKDPSPLGLFALSELDADRLDGACEVLDWARELVFSFDSGDPLDGPAFARIWSRDGDRGADSAHRAALALAADGPLAQTVVDELEDVAASIDDPTTAESLQLALASAYGNLERWDDLVAIGSELIDRHPSSKLAFMMACAGLGANDRWDEVASLAERRLDDDPTDAIALRALAEAAAMVGDLDRSDELTGRVLATSDALAMDYNQRAWYCLFRDAVDEQALMWAHTAIKRSDAAESYAAKHTLATLYAEMDMPVEAYQVIVEAIDEREEPRPVDWYVFGRMAETYGFPSAARRAYERVIDGDDDPIPVSTAALAARRLERLDTASTGIGPAGDQPSFDGPDVSPTTGSGV